MWKWLLGVLIILFLVVNLKNCVWTREVKVIAVTPVVRHQGPLPVLDQNVPALSVSAGSGITAASEHAETDGDSLQAIDAQERVLNEAMTD